MKPQPLDYAPPQPRRVPIAPVILATITLIVNGLLMAVAIPDRGWAAMWIVTLIGPAANGILALVAFYLAPNVKRMSASASTSMYLVAVFLPLIAILFDYALVAR